ncbi:MAG: FAD:protein FMN transferase [Tidjanibacter sp.]|nr:FAD:protein FMN transferase [Tidjanibacter sp.]
MKKKYVYMFVAAALAVIAVIYSNKEYGSREWAVKTLNGTALGTVYQVSVKGEMPEGLREGLDSLFRAADMSLSVFNPESRLSRINDNRTDTADRYIIYCLEMAHRVSEISEGMYDVTIRPLSAAMGFSGGEHTAELDNRQRDSLLQLVGYEKISIEGERIVKADPGMQIDLNSIAKGAVVDMAAELLEQYGVEEYLVDIGGEIFCRGTNAEGKDWTIGVETPFEGNYSMGDYLYTTVSISGVGLATSGNYRNFYTAESGKKYTHIVNPKTGENTEGTLLSATVVAESCALADAYGTMFISLGYERAVEVAEQNDIAALFIYADGGEMNTRVTPQMKHYWRGR